MGAHWGSVTSKTQGLNQWELLTAVVTEGPPDCTRSTESSADHPEAMLSKLGDVISMQTGY